MIQTMANLNTVPEYKIRVKPVILLVLLEMLVRKVPSLMI